MNNNDVTKFKTTGKPKWNEQLEKDKQTKIGFRYLIVNSMNAGLYDPLKRFAPLPPPFPISNLSLKYEIVHSKGFGDCEHFLSHWV